MKRSETAYPLLGLDFAKGLNNAWKKGWLNEFSADHFLIKAIEGRLINYPNFYQIPSEVKTMFPITKEIFQENFCVNFSVKITQLIKVFGESNIQRFFTDQLSAGKDHYDEAQFFRALSEVGVLSFLSMNAMLGEYEPQFNGKKNPEARFTFNNGIIVDVEVKTPGFKDFTGIDNIVIPTVLLDENGRHAFKEYCDSHGLHGALPRVNKLKDFLNSAADKFEVVDHVKHMNLLYINWTLSEFSEIGYQEAFSLLCNPMNGILTHKDYGISIGIKEDVFEKITAVIVYTEPLPGLMFGDLRWVWIRGRDMQPHFGIVEIHKSTEIFDVTGMNPNSERLTSFITGIFRDTSFVPDLMALISRHMLRP